MKNNYYLPTSVFTKENVLDVSLWSTGNELYDQSVLYLHARAGNSLSVGQEEGN